MLKLNESLWDCLMIGAGPTALAAAVYTAREDIKTLIIEKAVIGGLAAITEKVDNYPGFANGVAGLELAERLEEQAKRFGAIIELDEVLDLSYKKPYWQVELAGQNQVVKAKTVLIASGSQWKKLNIEGEEELYGKGIHNCATCDGAFYRDKKLVIIGGGNSAAQESLFLTKFAKEIEILIRKDSWKASDILVREVRKNPKIKIRHLTTPLKFVANKQGGMQAVLAQTAQTNQLIKCDGVFVFIGLKPSTDFLKNLAIDLDKNGFVITNHNFATNLDGLFCAGDVRSGATMQIASAVGEGASAALSIRHFLDS